jgi:hypothetical protein
MAFDSVTSKWLNQSQYLVKLLQTRSDHLKQYIIIHNNIYIANVTATTQITNNLTFLLLFRLGNMSWWRQKYFINSIRQSSTRLTCLVTPKGIPVWVDRPATCPQNGVCSPVGDVVNISTDGRNEGVHRVATTQIWVVMRTYRLTEVALHCMRMLVEFY